MVWKGVPQNIIISGPQTRLTWTYVLTTKIRLSFFISCEVKTGNFLFSVTKSVTKSVTSPLTPLHQGWCWGVCWGPHTGVHGGHGWSCHQLWPSLHSAPKGPESVVAGAVQSVKYNPSPAAAEPNTPEYTACPAGSISEERSYGIKAPAKGLIVYWLNCYKRKT